MWHMWNVKVGSREVTLCGPLVSKLMTGGGMELVLAKGERYLTHKDGSRTSSLLASDVTSITPVRALTGALCDEHGSDCP